MKKIFHPHFFREKYRQNRKKYEMLTLKDENLT